MIYLSTQEVIQLQAWIIQQSGGSSGVLDRGKIDSAVAQPRMTFGGVDLYPTLAEKAAALAYSLTRNRGFVDGNKRIAHAAMEVFLVFNGYEINAGVDEQEDIFLRLAAGSIGRDDLTNWIVQHLVPAASVP